MVEEMPDDWDPKKEGSRTLTDEEQARTDYLMRYLMASGKYYPTNAEQISIQTSASISELVDKGLFEEKVEEDKRYVRLLQKGFVAPYGWNLTSPIKWVIWHLFMKTGAEEYDPLHRYVTDKKLTIGGNNA